MTKFKFLYIKLLILEISETYSRHKRIINSIIFIATFYFFSGLGFLHNSEKMTVLIIFWFIYFLLFAIRYFKNRYLIHFKIIGFPFLFYSFIFTFIVYYNDVIIVDRFFVPSRLTIYYIETTNDGWGQYFTNVKKFGFSSIDAVNNDCIENPGTFLYVDHNGLINCSDNGNKVRTY